MQLFGDKFEQVAQSYAIANERKGHVVSLLAELPDTFTRNDLIVLRSRRRQSTHVATIISRWISAGFIQKVGTNEYKKMQKAYINSVK
jgi:hypothetical protein